MRSKPSPVTILLTHNEAGTCAGRTLVRFFPCWEGVRPEGRGGLDEDGPERRAIRVPPATFHYLHLHDSKPLLFPWLRALVAYLPWRRP